MPNDLEINCTIPINGKHGYRLSKIMNENKIEEMMQKFIQESQYSTGRKNEQN